MSDFVTRVKPGEEEPFTVIFTTDDHGKYMHIENECRKMIGHEKPTTNADRIRAMSDEELAELLEGEYGNMMPNTALSWLKEGVDDATD